MPEGYPRTYKTRIGEVTVRNCKEAIFNGHLCYCVELSGDVDGFFASDTKILNRVDHFDGSATIHYQSSGGFVEYAQKLRSMGAWAKGE